MADPFQEYFQKFLKTIQPKPPEGWETGTPKPPVVEMPGQFPSTPAPPGARTPAAQEARWRMERDPRTLQEASDSVGMRDVGTDLAGTIFSFTPKGFVASQAARLVGDPSPRTVFDVARTITDPMQAAPGGAAAPVVLTRKVQEVANPRYAQLGRRAQRLESIAGKASESRTELQRNLDWAKQQGIAIPEKNLTGFQTEISRQFNREMRASRLLGQTAKKWGATPEKLGVPTQPTFYSNVGEAFANPKLPEKMTGEQARAVTRAPGVKAEEIKWIGLDDFLKNKKSVTKREIQEFIDRNQIDVEEITKPARDKETQAKLLRLQAQRDDLYDAIHQEGNEFNDSPMIEEYRRRMQEVDREMRRLRDARDTGAAKYPPTNPDYATLSLPGADLPEANYREVLLRWKNKPPETHIDGRKIAEQVAIDYARQEYAARGDAFATQAEMESIMSDPLGMLSPMDRRLNEAIRAAGVNPTTMEVWGDRLNPLYCLRAEERGRYLELEEAANHRALSASEVDEVNALYEKAANAAPRRIARDFTEGHWSEPNVLAHLRLTDRLTPDGKKVLFIEETQSDWQKKIREDDLRGQGKRGEWEKTVADILKEKGLERYAPEVDAGFTDTPNPNNIDDLTDFVLTGQIPKGKRQYPDAPLVRDYPELLMKRVLRMAADGGYDGVAWTTGQQQAQRYSKALAEHVDRIFWDASSGQLIAYRNGQAVFDRPVSTTRLPEYIGRDAAEKLLRNLKRDEIPQELQQEAQRAAFFLNNVKRDLALRYGDGWVGEIIRRENWYNNQDTLQLRNAIKAVNQSQRKIREYHTPTAVLEGQDIAVGERGYSDVYDIQMRKAAEKVGKKFGVKAGEAEIVTGEGIPTKGWSYNRQHEAPFREWRDSQFHREDDGLWARKGEFRVFTDERLHEIYEQEHPVDYRQKVQVHHVPLSTDLRKHAITKGFPLFELLPPLAAAGMAAMQQTPPPPQKE